MGIQRKSRTAALAAAAVCAVISSGCDVGRGEPAMTPPAVTTGTNTDYFGGTSFIGRTVTVTGVVTQVITETSFALDTRHFGDESLLVLCSPSREVAVGDRVRVSGNVQKFDYRLYADDYDLDPDISAYQPFTSERILVTAEAMSGTADPDPDPTDG